jgi:curved DNA-binding protein CbpA
MSKENGRNFKRYKSQSECEVRLGTEIFKGRIVDCSDGIGAIIENAPQLVLGTHVDIKILDSQMEVKGEVVWVKESGDGLRVGFRRLNSLKGHLKDFKLADILIGLQRSIRTGILEIVSGSIVKKIFIKKGDMIFAISNNEDYRLGELLLKDGKITLEEYNQSADLLNKTGERLGKILVDLGMTPKEVFQAVRHQIEEIILSLFTIEEGRFEFQEGSLPTREVITLQISAANLIYRGIKRINNFTYIKQICPHIDAVLNLSLNPLNIFQDLTLEDSDKKILSYVNGIYSIKTILSLSPSKDFDTLKTICAFLSIGLIKVKRKDEAVVGLPIEEILSEPDEEITTEFAEKIEDLSNRCETLGYYEALGIEKEASIEEIKKAFYRLSKQFHPDRHFSLPSHDIKGKLIKILSYITKVYETLSDPEKRKEYDRTFSIKTIEQTKEAAPEATPSEERHVEKAEVPGGIGAAVTVSKYGGAEGEIVEERETAAQDEVTEIVPEQAIEEFKADEIKIQEEFKETPPSEEQVQQTSELTSDTGAPVTGRELSGTEEEFIGEGETIEKDVKSEIAPESLHEIKKEEVEEREEVPEMETVETASDKIAGPEQGRIKKTWLYIPVVIVVIAVLVVILYVMRGTSNKVPQRQIPAVAKIEGDMPKEDQVQLAEKKQKPSQVLPAASKQILPFPSFRDELFRKVLSESSKQR